MALSIDVVQGDVHATLVLVGDVDTKTAPELLRKLTELELHLLAQLRLNLVEVDFVSSAGLRAIVFAKQKMPHTSRLFLVGASEQIVETVAKTGLSQAIVIVASEDDI
ncbi:STAS domain-containing protein [Synechococcus sp. EJ6-Ellesmere]|uniref:STAS domain-containing protein n=1 Tax=Synechococcus sp. EJ6-Ellesmere TaxID=2823734 RepID=UPI0020CDE642|nr:STAS domain-containing protein [Synechococcus sp. EJ6-Ellesmere]MCP9826479.1 STAS domain-containing protein [Synechococcus sp. EJ6-Ellesmere]